MSPLYLVDTWGSSVNNYMWVCLLAPNVPLLLARNDLIGASEEDCRGKVMANQHRTPLTHAAKLEYPFGNVDTLSSQLNVDQGLLSLHLALPSACPPPLFSTDLLLRDSACFRPCLGAGIFGMVASTGTITAWLAAMCVSSANLSTWVYISGRDYQHIVHVTIT